MNIISGSQEFCVSKSIYPSILLCLLWNKLRYEREVNLIWKFACFTWISEDVECASKNVQWIKNCFIVWGKLGGWVVLLIVGRWYRGNPILSDGKYSMSQRIIGLEVLQSKPLPNTGILITSQINDCLNGTPMTSKARLFHCLILLQSENSSLSEIWISDWQISNHCSNLTLGRRENKFTLSFLWHPFMYWKTAMVSFSSLSFFRLNIPSSFKCS